MWVSSQWSECLERKPRAFRVLSALWRILDMAATEATLVLVDVGPNLGACNRAALVAADLYSLQGLRNLGPALRRWREQWSERRARNPVADLVTPAGSMNPIGYVLMQHPVRLDRPAKAYARCMERIPSVYAQAVRGSEAPTGATPESDPDCLVTLKHLRSLMPLAQEARKPMFALKPADGAIGGHASAVSACYRDFRDLALAVAKRAGSNSQDGGAGWGGVGSASVWACRRGAVAG